MPAVYSVEESNRLLNEIKDLLHEADTEQCINIAAIKKQIDEKFTELFTLYHQCNAKIDSIKSDLEKTAKQQAASNKVRFEHASGHT